MAETAEETDRRKISGEALKRFFPTGAPKPGAVTPEIAMDIIDEAKRNLAEEEEAKRFQSRNSKPAPLRKRIFYSLVRFLF